MGKKGVGVQQVAWNCSPCPQWVRMCTLCWPSWDGGMVVVGGKVGIQRKGKRSVGSRTASRGGREPGKASTRTRMHERTRVAAAKAQTTKEMGEQRAEATMIDNKRLFLPERARHGQVRHKTPQSPSASESCVRQLNVEQTRRALSRLAMCGEERGSFTWFTRFTRSTRLTGLLVSYLIAWSSNTRLWGRVFALLSCPSR